MKGILTGFGVLLLCLSLVVLIGLTTLWIISGSAFINYAAGSSELDLDLSTLLGHVGLDFMYKELNYSPMPQLQGVLLSLGDYLRGGKDSVNWQLNLAPLREALAARLEADVFTAYLVHADTPEARAVLALPPEEFALYEEAFKEEVAAELAALPALVSLAVLSGASEHTWNQALAAAKIRDVLAYIDLAFSFIMILFFLFFIFGRAALIGWALLGAGTIAGSFGLLGRFFFCPLQRVMEGAFPQASLEALFQGVALVPTLLGVFLIALGLIILGLDILGRT